MHYVFGISAVVATLVGATLPAIATNAPAPAGPILGVVSAALVATTLFTTPAKNARGYRAAWRQIVNALTAHRMDPSDKTISALRDALVNGEQIIAGRDPE
jgi:hypothetical protein